MSAAGATYTGSIIVPAHNEEQRGFRALDVLAGCAARLGVLVVVICNGCTDRTAELARTREGLRVVELAEAGKVGALNAGDRAAGDVFPRLYVDADLDLDVEGIASLLAALSAPGTMLVAPAYRFLVDGSPWLVRTYYGAMEEIPFLVRMHEGHFEGRGVYGVTAEARTRFGEFPPVLADDAFVDRMFDVSEKLAVTDATSGVPVPTSTGAFWRSRMRTTEGSRELARWLATEHPDRLVIPGEQPDPSSSFVRRATHHLRRGGLVASWRLGTLVRLSVYLGVEACTRLRVAVARTGRRSSWR